VNTSERQHRRALTLLSAAAFASAASARLCDPMLPDLARSFGSTPAAAAQVVSAFAIAYGLLQVFFGPLGDRFGRYRLVGWATLVCTGASLGAALAASLDWLTLARLLTGASAGGIIPLSMAWIGDTVPYEQRQTTLARFMSGQILGVIGGQLIGGFFVDTLGWRWAFAFIALVYLVVGVLVVRESRANPSTRHVRPTGARASGVVAQVRAVFAVGWARIVLLAVCAEGLVTFGALAFVPSYLHERFGLSLTMAGGLLAFFGLGGLGYILAARHLIRRLGEVGLATFGGVVIGLAWLLLALGEGWGWAMPASLLAGLGFYMLHNTLQANGTQMAPHVRGAAVSLFASAFYLGQSVGVVLAAMLFARGGAGALFGAAAVAMPLLGVAVGRALVLHHRHERESRAGAAAP
jgi:predicted MFS family arabinose efflux permease